MIDSMPRPRPPHMHREIDPARRAVWYVSVDKGPRIRLRAEFGSPDFEVQYQAALTGLARSGQGRAGNRHAGMADRQLSGDDGVVDAYPTATRRQRENIFLHVLERLAPSHTPRSPDTIMAGRERRVQPAQGRHFLDAMRGLFRWAFKAKRSNPIRPLVSRTLPPEGRRLHSVDRRACRGV